MIDCQGKLLGIARERRMQNLKLTNVRNVMVAGQLLHNIGLIVSVFVMLGVALDITALYKPFMNTATSVQTIILSICLLVLSRQNPYYGYSKPILYTTYVITAYLLIAFLSSVSTTVDVYIHDLILGDFNGHEISRMSQSTQIIMLSICAGIIMKSCNCETLRSIILFIGSFLPFNIFMAYVMQNEYVINGTGFWTMMILGFAAWGTLLRQVHRKHLRYFLADPAVQKISAILLGSIIVVFQGTLFAFPFVVPGARDLPDWWSVLPLVGEWVVIGAVIAAMSKVSSISYQNRKLIREKHIMATTDQLTKTHNRNGFYELIEKRNPHKSAGLILCDIDHFKKVNDTYGHDRGDEILKAFAECLKAHVRCGDCVIRWGGEEFLIFCENIDSDGLAELAERIRHGVAELKVIPPITASFGTDIFNSNLGLHASIKAADERLYRAKQLGRNIVINNRLDSVDHAKSKLVELQLRYPSLFSKSHIKLYLEKDVRTAGDEEALFKALNRMQLMIKSQNTVDRSANLSANVKEFLSSVNSNNNKGTT